MKWIMIDKGNNEWIDGFCKEAVYVCNKLRLHKTLSAWTLTHWNNILSSIVGNFSTHIPVFTRTRRTPPLFENVPELILGFEKLIFGDYERFSVEWLLNDVMGDLIQKYMSKSPNIGEKSPEYMILSSILTSNHLMRWLINGHVGLAFERDSTKNLVVLMVMRNHSRYCIKKSSSKLTKQKSNPDATYVVNEIFLS